MKISSFGFLASVILAVGCKDLPSSPVGRDVPSATLRIADGELREAAQGRRSRGIEDEFLRMELEEPGFGGLYRDEAGQVVIRAVRGTPPDRVRAVVGGMIGRIPTLRRLNAAAAKPGELRVVDGDYPFSRLVAMQKQLLAGDLPAEVVGVDADERMNRVRVAIEDASAAAEVLEAARAVGVPAEAIEISISERAVTSSNLRETVRPVGAGLQIKNGSTTCTMGFIVDVEFYDQHGFLTAAHCRGAASAIGDGATGGSIHQSVVGPTTKVGEIEINPAFNLTAAECGSHSLCTWADAMFVEQSFVSTMPGQILGSTSVAPNNTAGSYGINWHFGALSKGVAVVGDSLDMIGRTSGHTRGAVFETCVAKDIAISVSPYSFRVLCGTGMDGAMAGAGDSGAPIFFWSGPTNNVALGVQFATNSSCSPSCKLWYSGWYEVEYHLNRYLSAGF